MPGAFWDTSSSSGNVPPFELSPQHFSELASELKVTEAQQRMNTDVPLTLNYPILNVGTAPAAPSAREFLSIADTINPLAPPQPGQHQQPQQHQSGSVHGLHQAAAQISRLYNHMLLQLPPEVQRRTQQHLLLRTASVSKSGVPVQQATMLVQQELLPIMQQAFMRLQQAKSIRPAATNPSTIHEMVKAQQEGVTINSGAHGVALLNASAMKNVEAGKAAAATDAVIQLHRAGRQGLGQPNDAHRVQQQHAEQQRQHAALIQHQQQQHIQKLQAMQAIHMQQQQQQQQQMATGSRNNNVIATAAAPSAAAITCGYNGSAAPLPNEGPAQGLRHELMAGPSPNSNPNTAPPLPTMMRNMHTMHTNKQMSHTIGIATEDLDTNLTTTAGAAAAGFNPQQQKRQRTGDGCTKDTPTNKSVYGVGNQFLEQWDDLFQRPSGGPTMNGNYINNNSQVNPIYNNGVLTNQQDIKPRDQKENGKDVVEAGVGAPSGTPTPAEDHRLHQTSLNQILSSPPMATTTDAGVHVEPALDNVDEYTIHPNACGSGQRHPMPNDNGIDGIDARVGIAAVSRGKAAAAKMHAKEAAQRYSWTANMLNEIFKPTPADTTGLLKQEHNNALTLTTTAMPSTCDAVAKNISTSVDGRGGETTTNSAFPPPHPHPHQSCDVAFSPINGNGTFHQEMGTEGQRMLADAAKRVHQSVALTNSNLAAPMKQQEQETTTLADARIASNIRIVPVQMAVTTLQLASATENKTETQ
jgi:hypothetical protein